MMTDTIITLLNNTFIPEFNSLLGDMGAVITHSKDNEAHIDIRFPFPIENIKSHLQESIHHMLLTHGITSFPVINIHHFIKAHVTQMPGQALRGIKNVIAVASGKGGVGKSTVTTNLAVALSAMGAKTGILDADIYGPSIPMMLGIHEKPAIDGERYLPPKAHGVYAMSIGMLTELDNALIWRGPMLAKALVQMINITEWDDLDYLFIDLPPGTGDIQLTLVQKIPVTAAVIVTTPQPVATLDAEKAIKMFERTQIHTIGIVENMSVYHCPSCHHSDFIFGEHGAEQLVKKHHIPLLGQLPLIKTIREEADSGIPSVLNADKSISQPFFDMALSFARQLAKRPININV